MKGGFVPEVMGNKEVIQKHIHLKPRKTIFEELRGMGKDETFTSLCLDGPSNRENRLYRPPLLFPSLTFVPV